MELSDADRRILRALQDDTRISNQALADRAGLSASACWRRVRALEEAGVIAGYPAALDAGRCGLGFAAIVHVTMTRHDASQLDVFIERVAERPEVLECYATTGEADYHLRVVCRDKEAYNEFLEGFMFRLPGIAHVRTNLVLKDIKLHGRLPV